MDRVSRERTLRLAPKLARRIGEHKVIDTPELLDTVAGDESHCTPQAPDLLVRSSSEDDVVAVLELAAAHGVPVTPRGGGTGKAGGAIPVAGGLVLDTSGMTDIKEIDKANLSAVVQPGVVTGNFHEFVEREGLFYPPDPNSWESCCLGGNVAHNAGGPRAFKYGVTRDYTMGIEAVLMGGQKLVTGRRTVKCAAGYDLSSLLVGSEGTLAVFTEFRFRLVHRPRELATLLIPFPDEIAAGTAIAAIVTDGLVPRVMELMDSITVQTLRDSGAGAIPTETGALLLAEVDGDDENSIDSQIDRLAHSCEEAGASNVLMARHGTEREKLWAARRQLSDAIRKHSRFKISEDVAVPRREMATLLARLRDISAKLPVTIASYGHAGDGNFHINLLWDDPEFDPSDTILDILQLTVKLGGTITGEHGIGLAKKKYLGLQRTPEHLNLLRQIKAQFDPLGLLNPDKIFP